MKEDLKDILSHLSSDVDQEALLQYLKGKLSAGQQHEVEKQMLDDQFTADAMEGLEAIKDKQRIGFMVEQLNHQLKKKAQKKQALKEKSILKNEPWLVITVVIILILVILSFLFIHHLQR
jgi:hypothetical protein